MPNADSFVQKIKEDFLDKNVDQLSNEYISVLAVSGFCLISPGKTHPFLVENVAAPVYVSVVHSSTVWVANFPLDPKVYGCMSILSESISNGKYIIAVSPYNPEAHWCQANSRDRLSSDIIQAGFGLYDQYLYFGRKASINGGLPCVIVSNGGHFNGWLTADGVQHGDGEYLKNTGFELIRAKRGDPVPPNAVMAGVTEADGSPYVGRVGGTIPCHVTTEDGKIQCFIVYGLDKKNKEIRVANGEVMVLTR